MKKRPNGTGSVIKRPSGKYRATVQKSTPHGAVRRSKTFKTKAEAVNALPGMLAALGERPEGLTFDGYFWDVYVPMKAKRLAKSTMDNYTTAWRLHISPVFGQSLLCDPPHQRVQALADSLARPTAEMCVKVMRVVLRQAWYDGQLGEEPMRMPVHYPRAAMPDGPTVWTRDEVMEAFHALHGSRLEAVWLVMAGAGLRREEALALSWADVSFRDGRAYVRVDKAKTTADGMKGVKTRYSVRTAVCGHPFAQRLEELSGRPSEPLCALSPSGVSCAWRREHERRLSGLPYIPLNRMRATHETLLQQAGVSDSVNARIHGHSRASAVDYTHYMEPGAEAAEAAADLMSR